MAKDPENRKQDNLQLIQNTAKWVAIGTAITLGLAYAVGILLGFKYDDKFIDIMYQHMGAVIGIPGSIITAFVIVTVLEQVSGQIKLEIFNIKFEGAAGPIIMWVIVFCSLVSSLKILW